MAGRGCDALKKTAASWEGGWGSVDRRGPPVPFRLPPAPAPSVRRLCKLRCWPPLTATFNLVSFVAVQELWDTEHEVQTSRKA